METIEVVVKSYFLFFVGMFLVGVAINQTTKKEYRQSLRRLWRMHCQITLSISAVGLVIFALAWFIFKVL